MHDFAGFLILAALIASILGVAFKLLRRRAGYSEYDCPNCEHFVDESCNIPDKPYMKNCRAFRRILERK